MIFKITDEQRDALKESPGRPVKVQDEETGTVYLLVGEEAVPELWESYIRREVKKGLAAADRDEVEEWDTQSIKAEGRSFLKGGSNPPT